MKEYIEDRMKKEIIIPLVLAIGCYFLFALSLFNIFQQNENWREGETLITLPMYFLFGTFGVFYSIDIAMYRVKINKEKIIIKSLFRKKEVNICEVKKYSYTWNKVYKIHQYTLFMGNKKVMLNSHYKNEIEQILNENGAQKIK